MCCGMGLATTEGTEGVDHGQEGFPRMQNASCWSTKQEEYV
jgi:hypothetical protein